MGFLSSKNNSAKPDRDGRRSLNLIMEILLPNRYHRLKDFEVTMLGYDRRQVQEYINDLTAQLDEALAGVDANALLHQQLYEANCRIDELERRGEPPLEDLPWNARIGRILEHATEQATAIRAEAQREAERIRDRAQSEALRTRRELEAALQARREREQRLEDLLTLGRAEGLARTT